VVPWKGCLFCVADEAFPLISGDGLKEPGPFEALEAIGRACGMSIGIAVGGVCVGGRAPRSSFVVEETVPGRGGSDCAGGGGALGGPADSLGPIGKPPREKGVGTPFC
jgi:hypothetical protein